MAVLPRRHRRSDSARSLAWRFEEDVELEADLARAEQSDALADTHEYAARHSPLKGITPANAPRLKVACAYQVGSIETFVTGPLVWQGTMYLTTARLTIALDAASCREKWRHNWEPLDEFTWRNNRGVAIRDGYVVRGTADGYLLALDAASGKLLWARQVARPAHGEDLTMPPLIVDDVVVIGPAGSEKGGTSQEQYRDRFEGERRRESFGNSQDRS